MKDIFLNNGILIGTLLLLSIFLVRSLLIAGGVKLLVDRCPWLNARRVVLPEKDTSDWKRELRRGVLVLAGDALVTAFFVISGIFVVKMNPTTIEILVTVAGLFIWLEIYFYALHRALHHPKLFWIHRYHHQGHGTTAWTSLSFSFLERAFLLLGSVTAPALVSRWLPLSLNAWAIYFFLNFILNVYGHMNSEIVPRWFARSPLIRWINTSTSHGMHHLRYKGHYGLFTPFLDRWLGTEFPDYPERLEAVLAGRGAEARGRFQPT